MQTYATAADRTNQWPAPWEGALSYLMDSHTPWIYRAGAWHGIPLGYSASAIGPASAATITQNTTVLTLAAPVAAGRRYRVTAQLGGSQSGVASATTFYQLSGPIDSAQGRFAQWTTVAANALMYGSAAWPYSPVTAATPTWGLFGFTTSGSVAVGANTALILLEDIGS
jgi:hypothetical protein